MYENLRGRVSRIISAGVSAFFGAVEGLSPEGVMEEAIKEVDEAAREVREELDRVLASKHLADKRRTEKETNHRELTQQIALAVSQSRDDLAEAGIARQLDIEAQLPVLRSTLDDLGNKEHELHSYISALESKKREMREELNKLRAAKAAAPSAGAAPAAPEAGAKPGGISSVGRKVDQASSAFDRILARESGLPSSPGAALADQAKLAELEKLSRDNRIQERLAAAKAELKK